MSPARWPRYFLLVAAAIALAHVACDLAGFRPAVATLTGVGVAGASGADGAPGMAAGIAFAATHLALVLLAPVFALAGIMGVAVHRRV